MGAVDGVGALGCPDGVGAGADGFGLGIKCRIGA